MKQRGANQDENFLNGIILLGGNAPTILSEPVVHKTVAFGFDFSKSKTCLSLKKQEHVLNHVLKDEIFIIITH